MPNNSLLKKRVNVRTNGIPRNLLNIEENKAGDVYLRIKSGTQVGTPPNAIEVLQDRFSIHPSPKSPNYSTLKSTFQLKGYEPKTSKALTDAVKLKTGFSHLFSHRSSDLAAPVYDVNSKHDNILELGDFNPNLNSLIFSVFVGHPDSKFPANSGSENVNTFSTVHFQFIVCHVWIPLPALPFAWTLKSITDPPEIYDNDMGKKAAYQRMRGDTPDTCLKLFHYATGELTANLLETYKQFTKDSENIEFIQSLIEQIPGPPSVRI